MGVLLLSNGRHAGTSAHETPKFVHKKCRDYSGAQSGERASNECAAKPHAFRKNTERRRAEPKRHIEKGRIGAYSEPAVLRWRAAHRFHAERGIDERITKPR